MSTSSVNQLIDAIAERSGVDPEAMDLKIRFGKNGRTIFGQMASGEQRDELTEDRIDLISAVIKEAPSQRGELNDYAQKNPQLEIRSGDNILFRQERDGVVSTNALWQPETEVGLDNSWSTQIAAIPAIVSEPEGLSITTPQEAAQAIISMADELMNPLGDPSLTEPVVMVGDYALVAQGNNLAVMLNESPVAYRMGTEAIAVAGTSPAIAQAFSQWVAEPPLSQPIATEFYHDSAQEPHFAQVLTIDLPPALVVASQQIAQLPESDSKAFFQSVVEDLAVHSQRAVQAVKDGLESETFQTVKQTVLEGAKKTFKAVQEELGSERVQTLKQQAQSSLQAGGTKALEVGGRGLEKAGQWLASRPAAIRTHQAAKAALEVFNQGFERTQERQYEHHDFRVAFEGRNTYRLSDRETGQDLLRFKVESVFYQKDPKITVLEQPDTLSREQSQALSLMRQDAENVRGSERGEQHHAQKSEQFAIAARSVAQYNETNHYQDHHYSVEIGSNSLVVMAVDGRGELYHQQGDQIESRLETQDFERASKVMQMLQQVAQAQETNRDFELN
ncbi:hypothetical protein AB3R30_20900 [Leptolyngbyaceae cyanobacterium UHCC 1019]